MFFYNITDEKKLKELAESELKKFKYTGYSGSFTTFGEPVVYHGDIITLKNPKMPERNGKYLVRAVERTYDAEAAKYRQKIYINEKISDL